MRYALVVGVLIALCASLLGVILVLKQFSFLGDAAIAMISVGSLAFGYLLMNIFSTSANLSGDVCSTLFGSTSILTLQKEDVWMCAVLSVFVLLFYIFFYHRIFQITFNETFAKSLGMKVELYHLLLAVVMAVIIVLAMHLVGSLLISALLIFPALSAMRVCKSFKGVVLCAALISVVCFVAGVTVSYFLETPTGASVVVTDLIAYGVFSLLGTKK